MEPIALGNARAWIAPRLLVIRYDVLPDGAHVAALEEIVQHPWLAEGYHSVLVFGAASSERPVRGDSDGTIRKLVSLGSSPTILSASYVVHTTGFGAAVVRAALGAMSLLARKRPERTFASPDGVAQWLSSQPKPPAPRDLDRLQHVIGLSLGYDAALV